MQREGSFREMKRHVHYEKPSEKRARQKAEAVRRARKLARKRAQREGLIAAPKKPAPVSPVALNSASLCLSKGRATGAALLHLVGQGAVFGRADGRV